MGVAVALPAGEMEHLSHVLIGHWLCVCVYDFPLLNHSFFCCFVKGVYILMILIIVVFDAHIFPVSRLPFNFGHCVSDIKVTVFLRFVYHHGFSTWCYA